MLTGQVFVSHTSDLARFPEGRSFVQAALDGVGRAGMAPVDMRYFAAREGQPADYCRLRVRECEVYVAVIGFCYGSLVPGAAVSYTELEFREASAAELPRLVFLLDQAAGLPVGLADLDRGKVQGFRQRLREAGLILAKFTSSDSLELEVFHALSEVSRRRPTARPTLVTSTRPTDTTVFTGRNEQLEQIKPASGAILREMVERLLDLDVIANPVSRKSIVLRLRKGLAMSIPYDPSSRPHVVNIVTRSLDYPGGLAELIEAVKLYADPTDPALLQAEETAHRLEQETGQKNG